MESSEYRLLPHLERALKRAYDRPSTDAIDGPEVQAGDRTIADEPPMPETIGRFRMRGVIARGGMGTVYRAEDPALGRDVALKIGRSLDPALLPLFVEEARVSAGLQHPGIVPIYERGLTDDGRPYYVMKLVHGATFSTVLGGAKTTAAELPKMLEIFLAICRTIAFVHARGVSHGDLKPSNVMVGDFGETLVMDWGVAGQPGPESGPPADRPARLAVGTPAYMPPERARGSAEIDGARADVFALGAVLCEILTGAPPYCGADRRDTFLKAADARLDDALRALDSSGADPVLIDLARRCLAPNPADRPADAEVVATILSEHLGAVGRRAREAELELASTHARHAAERRTRRVTTALAIVVAVGVLGGVAGFMMFSEERRSRQSEVARQVDEAALGVHRLLAEAQAREPEDPDTWTAANAAAERAAALAERSGADDATRARSQSLLAETRKLVNERLRRIALQDRLEEIEHQGLEDSPSPEWSDAAYAEAFRDFGFDPNDVATVAGADERTLASLGLALARRALARRRAAKDADAGESFLRAAMRVDPDPARRDLIDAFLAGDRDRLRDTGRTMELLGAPPESMLLVAHFLIALNHAGEAVEVLRAACLRHPADFRVHHDLASRLTADGEAAGEDVVRLLSVCVAVRPKSAHSFIDLGSAYYARGDLGRAVLHLRHATAMNPATRRGWLVLTIALSAAGEIDDAEAAATNYIAVETDPRTLALSVAAWAQRLDPNLVERGLRRAVALAPESAVARVELGRFLLDRGACAAAADELLTAARLLPNDAKVQQRLGRARLRTLDFGGASQAFAAACRLDADSAELHDDLAKALLIEGKIEAALDACDAADEIDEAAGNADAETSRRRKALRLAAEIASPAALELEAVDARSALNGARLAGLRGWWSTSARLFEEAMSREPSLEAGWREEAALVGATAGSSAAAAASESERRGFRDRALRLLRMQLEDLVREAEENHVQTSTMVSRLNAWANCGSFPSERAGPSFAALDADERASWKELWNSVEATIVATRKIETPAGVALERSYSAATLGVSGPLAGLELSSDGRTLYLVSNAGFDGAVVESLPVRRDPVTRAITGFGAATTLSAAGHADGGLGYGPKGTLFWSTWQKHELGQRTVAGVTKRFPLNGSGAPAGGGGLVFGALGTPIAGELLLSSFADGGIYRVALRDNGDGTFAPLPSGATLVARCPPGSEGMRFIPAGKHAGDLLLCNWTLGTVGRIATNRDTGLPMVDNDGRAIVQNFMRGVAGAAGTAFDPISGALLVSSWGSGNRIHVFTGVLE